MKAKFVLTIKPFDPMKSSAHTVNKPRFFGLKRSTIIELVSALFILLFLYTGLSKSFEISNTVATIRSTAMLNDLALPIAWAVVIIEYLVAALLFFPKTKRVGIYSSLALMVMFTLYIGYMMVFVPNLPCSCGGVISKMTWSQHLIFNLFFIALALTGILAYKNDSAKKDSAIENQPIVFT